MPRQRIGSNAVLPFLIVMLARSPAHLAECPQRGSRRCGGPSIIQPRDPGAAR
jgi:hypothetical protein